MIAYIVKDVATATPRYVGITKSKSARKRWNHHVFLAKSGSGYRLHRAIAKHGHGAFGIEVVACARSWDDLIRLEKDLIVQHHTFHRDGIGYNMTLGGEGALGSRHSNEQRSRWSMDRRGATLSAETRSKISAANKGRRLSPEHISKISAAQKGIPRSTSHLIQIHTGTKLPDWRREKLHASTRGKPKSTEHKAKLSDAAKLHGVSDATRAAQRAALTGRKLTPAHVAKIRAGKLAAKQRRSVA